MVCQDVLTNPLTISLEDAHVLLCCRGESVVKGEVYTAKRFFDRVQGTRKLVWRMRDGRRNTI